MDNLRYVHVLPVVLGVIWLAAQCFGYSNYQLEIPNGDNVPHPCKVNYRWPGLGHENPYGGGSRNPFGVAFANAGHKWTRDLCMEDSDGDGKTNGQELGDHSCVWIKGKLPSRANDLTHPGVCEPMNSTLCQNRIMFVDCHLQEFARCDRLNQTDVQNVTLRFPQKVIPAQETNYYCMTFDLPSDQDYHIIAFEPVIDNRDVMHHILLYGCKSDSQLKYSQPTTCGMNAETMGCYDIIAAWTVGSPGKCLPETVGYKMGKSSYRRAMMQIHWNNPRLVQNYTDSSGLRIYYHPSRANIFDLAMFGVGQNILEIPPGLTDVAQYGVCPGSCTAKLFSEPVYVVTGLNHMHYLGRKGRVELFRNGSKVTDLTYDENYSYDSPVTHLHDPPIQVLPGDEIRTTCVYNSVSSNRYVYFGESTQEEMCVMFLTVYPARAVRLGNNCVQVGVLNTCDRLAGVPVDGCNWKSFTNLNSPNMTYYVERLMADCNLDGFCRPECRQIRDEIAQHPCMKGEILKVINLIFKMSKQGVNFLVRYHSCPDETQYQPDSNSCSKATCGC
ncbi:DBH-like monooxygenase protein 2 [Bulinus truncatus]|nr:DBH-like monooxygenase protein 2 [Bulinus truncatus]